MPRGRRTWHRDQRNRMKNLPERQHGVALRCIEIRNHCCRIEPVSVLSNRSRATKIWISKNRDRRLAAASRPIPLARVARSVAGTGSCPANPRKIRVFCKRPETAKNYDSGWLGRQDSNLQMTFRKMPFEMSGEFALISEHFGT